jgi:hypothetical protein
LNVELINSRGFLLGRSCGRVCSELGVFGQQVMKPFYLVIYKGNYQKMRLDKSQVIKTLNVINLKNLYLVFLFS